MRDNVERPQARTSDLVIKAVGDEVLVYDLMAHRAHSLNRLAAAVWRACDGTRDVRALGMVAAVDQGPPVPPEAVRYALQALDKARLLEGGLAEERGVTRRQVMASLGTAAAVALPLVTTIIAPSPARAVSCKNINEPCSFDEECCGTGCDLTTGGCSCNLFKNLGKRCLRLE